MNELNDAVEELEAPVETEEEVEAAEPEEESDDIADIMSRELGKARATVQAPDHWPAEDKEFFASLPDDAARERTLAWRKSLEGGYQAKFEALAETRKLAEDIDHVFNPLGVAKEHRGEAIRRLVAAEAMIRQDPIRGVAALVGGAQMAGTENARTFIQHLASELGVEVGGLAGQAQPKSPQEQRLAALERQIMQRERQEEDQRRQQFAHVTQSAQSKIQEFAQAKDASGQALRPHFDRVKATMGSLIQAAAASGQQLALDQAYEQAVWAVPELRAELQKAEQARAAQAAAEARKVAVAKAKGARTPKTASARVPDTNDADDLEALLAAGIREMAA